MKKKEIKKIQNYVSALDSHSLKTEIGFFLEIGYGLPYATEEETFYIETLKAEYASRIAQAERLLADRLNVEAKELEQLKRYGYLD